MKNKLVLTLVLGCLLGGLLFYIIFFEKEKIELEETEKLMFPNFVSTEVLGLTFKPLASDRFIISLTEEGWRVTEPFKYQADRFTIDELLNNFSTFAVDSLVEENAKDLDKYGLTNAVLELRVKNKDTELTTLLGEMSFDGQSRYVKKPGDKNVYLIESTKVEPLLKGLEQFMDRNILDINANNLNKIKYNYENELVSLNLNQSGAWALENSSNEINQETVQGFITQIANLDADSFYDLNGTPSLSFDDLLYEVALGFAGSSSDTLVKVVREEGSGENLIIKVETDKIRNDMKDVLFKISETQFKSVLLPLSAYEVNKAGLDATS